MMRSLYTASTGMYAQQMNVDNLANNMANVNTTAFKKQRVEFQDLLYQTIKRPTTNETTNQPVGLSLGLGVKTAVITTNFSQGNLQNTENSLDVAINGEAFFKIEVPGYDDPLFTRNGAFQIDASGQLVTADGYVVVGSEEIPEDAYDVAIDTDGTITYMTADDTEAQTAGKIELAKFMNPNGLSKLGNSLYVATANSGEPIDWDSENDSSVSLSPGYLEMANVQIVEEMVNLISAQRAYDINSKVIQSSDEMLQTATNLRR